MMTTGYLLNQKHLHVAQSDAKRFKSTVLGVMPSFSDVGLLEGVSVCNL
jgi:hypothetical protein